MFEFILAYWWLFILLIVLVAVITRSLIRFVTTIIVSIVLFVLFWQILIQPGFIQSNQCFVTDADLSISLNQKAKLMNPGIERNIYICSESAGNFNLLESCLNNSKQSNKLSFTFFSSLPWFNNTLNEVVIGQNQSCTNDKLVMPSF